VQSTICIILCKIEALLYVRESQLIRIVEQEQASSLLLKAKEELYKHFTLGFIKNDS
jgi:hypothetical protein